MSIFQCLPVEKEITSEETVWIEVDIVQVV
jgi:hypothetical protein